MGPWDAAKEAWELVVNNLCRINSYWSYRWNMMQSLHFITRVLHKYALSNSLSMRVPVRRSQWRKIERFGLAIDLRFKKPV